MSGVAAIFCLLSNSAPLVAVVAAGKIKAEEAAIGAELPVIVIQEVSINRRETLAASSTYLYTARVQVSVEATTTAQREQVLNLIIAALPRTRGTVNGVNVDSILYESHGPKFKDIETSGLCGSVDYFVKYNA